MLVDAIDRAGSTEPAKIQAALKATDLKPDQLIMGYKGVKFDDKGQNILAAGLMIQLQDGENYVTVWPKATPRQRPSCPTRAGNDPKGRGWGPAHFISSSHGSRAQPARPLTCPPSSFR